MKLDTAAWSLLFAACSCSKPKLWLGSHKKEMQAPEQGWLLSYLTTGRGVSWGSYLASGVSVSLLVKQTSQWKL